MSGQKLEKAVPGPDHESCRKSSAKNTGRFCAVRFGGTFIRRDCRHCRRGGLVLTPTGSRDSRIQYEIQILHKGASVFQTRVLLKNNRSMTIGGPQAGPGILLFHITGSVP
jgi:hypothetical protein